MQINRQGVEIVTVEPRTNTHFKIKIRQEWPRDGEPCKSMAVHAQFVKYNFCERVSA